MSDVKSPFSVRVSRVVARLPWMLTEEDDYSWVPLGDVLVALHDIDASEQAWPEDGERIRMTTLRDAVLKKPDYEAAVDALEQLVDAARYHADDCYIQPAERTCVCGLLPVREKARAAVARLRGDA